MSNRTSHRRRARQFRNLEVQSVPCERCGWPSLSYECFTECRDAQGRRVQ